jgi:Flp pilus assembly protein TadG
MAAVEMAMLSPVFLLVLGGAVDYGGAMQVKFNLDNAVTAASNFALNNASKVASATGSALATQLAAIVVSSHGANWANASVTLNNGPAVTVTSGVSVSSGATSNADSCYCPTGAMTAIVWGSAVACGSACANGSLAGKYVVISASHSFSPLVLPHSLIGSSFSATSVVETK